MAGIFRTGRASPPARPEVLLSIQALRGLAALAVVAYHALQRVDDSFDIGRAGVDVFFVISGLVIWRVTSGRDVSPAEFLRRRLTRIVPFYWLTTLAVLAAALAWPRILPVVRPGFGHLLLSLAFIPHLDPRGLPFPTLPPGWSLNYEMVFYMVFAIALAGPRAWRLRTIVWSLAGLAALGVLIPPLYFLGANPMLLQFAAGVGLGVATERLRPPPAAVAAAMVLAALGLWTMVQTAGLFSELWRPLLWGVPAVLTVAGAVGLETRGILRAVPGRAASAVLALGDASYAIYLLHLPATALVAVAIGPWAPGWLFLAASMTTSVAAGLAGRAWLERPILKWLQAAGSARGVQVTAI